MDAPSFIRDMPLGIDKKDLKTGSPGGLALRGIRSLIGLLGRVQAEIGIDPVGRASRQAAFSDSLPQHPDVSFPNLISGPCERIHHVQNRLHTYGIDFSSLASNYFHVLTQRTPNVRIGWSK
jgi:hypothetical protein